MLKRELILALETSSRIGSAALALGPEILAQTTFTAPMRHSAEIFGAVTGLLTRFNRKPAQIDHVYISVGPGSFTGLRISVTIAKAMHFANRAHIVAVNTLDVIAANVPIAGEPNRFPDRIATILDAKRNQFYIAAYRRPPEQRSHTSNPDSEQTRPATHNTQHTNQPIWQKLIPDSLMTAPQFLETFAEPADPIALLGDGLLYQKDKFQSPGTIVLDERYWSPQAANVHALGYRAALNSNFADPLKLIPSYIRRPEAEEKWQQR